MVEISLTEEQDQVANAHTDCKLQAFAGSGKSTALLAYIALHPKEKILYLCFNKPNRIEFQKKTTELHYHNVTVSTIHGLAYNAIIKNNKTPLTGSLQPQILFNLLEPYLDSIPNADRLLIIHHTQRLIKCFCASRENKLASFIYSNSVPIEHAGFVIHYEDIIYEFSKVVMKAMHSAAIPILHDYYLKLYQINYPKLDYDTILFDEVQDCTPAMLDIIENQHCKKIFSGDQYQEIYAWRGAVNTFSYLQYPQLSLNQSFRFSPGIGTLATKVLKWRTHLVNESLDNIVEGVGPNINVTGNCYISRSTVGLIKEATELIRKNPKTIISFQGGLHGYITHELGFTLLDLHNSLSNNSYKHPFLEGKDLKDLYEYADHTEDNTLTAFLKIHEEYGHRVPSLISMLQKSEKASKSEAADITFSTVHRIKGMEFQTVTLANDFYTFEDLLKNNGNMDSTELKGEANTLYVAITRASQDLFIDKKYLK